MRTARKFLSQSLLIGLLPLLGSISCSKLDVQEIPISANPSSEIEKLEAAHREAGAKQIDILAPKYFKDATESLKEAKESRSKDKDSDVILKSVARGNASLVKAEEVARVARITLEPTVIARQAAVAADAPRLVTKDFNEADKDLMDITKEIENNNLSSAEKQRASLTKRYSELELRAIKQTHLGEARKLTEQAEKEGAEDNASRTLKETQARIKEADLYITDNRQDKAGVELQGTLALASAKHLLELTRQTKVMGNKDAETIVLEREAQARKLNAATNENVKADAKVAQLENKTKDLANENSLLEAQQRADAMLDAAKAQFNADEADVYRDGQKLVIRLKKLAFPNGKANLTPEAMPLLAKVNQSIRSLGTASRIEVQGHTDSSGNQLKNQKLSEKRAEAIKAYLIANGLDASNITTVGYGDTKPLAANKTKQGRAQNRRVDIVIEPLIPTT